MKTTEQKLRAAMDKVRYMIEEIHGTKVANKFAPLCQEMFPLPPVKGFDIRVLVTKDEKAVNQKQVKEKVHKLLTDAGFDVRDAYAFEVY